MQEVVELGGSSLLRLFGDRASLRDARAVAHAIVSDASFRARCSALSRLLGEEPRQARIDGALALLHVVVADGDAPDSLNRRRDATRSIVTTGTRLALALLQSRVTWHEHFERRDDGVSLSRGLSPIVKACAMLWGITPSDLGMTERVDVCEGEEG